MTRMRSTALLLWVAASLMPFAARAQTPYKIIANGSIGLGALSKKAVSDAFMKKTAKWDNGTAVVPVDQVESAAVRDSFSRTVHGKPAAAVKSYWNQQVFSGRDVPPVEKKSDAEVLAFVRSTPGAIGYVSAETETPGVKVVSVQ